jgi:hypothetical protein
VDFPREHILEIRGTRFTVISHFDDTREPLNVKMARLLRNDVENMDFRI